MHINQEDLNLDRQCRGALSLVPVYFCINSGQIHTQSDEPLRVILFHILDQLSRLDENLAILATWAGHEQVVDAIYHQDALPLVNGESPVVVERLDPQEKARLLAQGIAGCVSIASRLSKLGLPVTPALLSHELNVFSTSRQPEYIRHTMETSSLFRDCLMMSQILDLIMEASHDVDTLPPAKCASFEDYNADAFSFGYERPSRNMGLPWGFSFLALN